MHERFVTVQDGLHHLSLVLFQRNSSLPKQQLLNLLIPVVFFHTLLFLGSGAEDGLGDANR